MPAIRSARSGLSGATRRRLLPAAVLAATLLLMVWAAVGCATVKSLTRPLTGEVRQKGPLESGVRRDLGLAGIAFDPVPYQKNETAGRLDNFFAPTDRITFKLTVANNGESTERQVQTDAFLYQTTSGGLPREVPAGLVAEKHQIIAELGPGRQETVSYTFSGLKRYWQKSHLVARFSVAPPPGETNTGDNLRKVYFWMLIGE